MNQIHTARGDLLAAISELGELFPDWRFGQLVANLHTAAAEDDHASIWDTEDEQLLAAAQRLVERHRDRLSVKP
jgi:hypothetical protein